MKLDKRKFARWLAAKPANEVVGTSRDSCGCPIAKFYADVSGYEINIFQGDASGGYVVDRGYSRRELPAWAEEFVFAIDRDAGGVPITAARALEALT